MMIVTALLLVLQTAPAPAEVPVAGRGTEAPAPKEKKICRPDGSTGSRLGGRVCRTEAEWEAIRKAEAAKKAKHH